WGGRWHHAKLQYLARRARVCRIEVYSGHATAKRLIRPEIAQDELRTNRDLGEIYDDVRPLGRRYEQCLAHHGRRQKAAVGPDRPEGQTSGELEDQKARVAGIQETEAIAALLNVQKRPGAAVDDHGVGKDLRVPDGRDVAVAVADVGPGEAIKKLPVG